MDQTQKPIPEKRQLLVPPFHKTHELQHHVDVFPPYYVTTGFDPHRPIRDIIQEDLQTSRLEKIHSHLWLAGLPKPARSLHRQIVLDRTIVPTQDPNEHLTWRSKRVFIKPLPEYLLHHDFWINEGKVLLQDESLYRSACGMILSYCWLICTRLDLAIAHENRLVSSSVTWEKWVAFVSDFLSKKDLETLEFVAMRYHYGELRVSRLDLIWRVAPSVFSINNARQGFMPEPQGSRQFLERHFRWLLSVFGFITIVASSMQVGLGNDRLQNSSGFQNATLGFTALSLIGTVGGVILVGIIWGLVCVYHIYLARRNLGMVLKKRDAKAKVQA